jgi:hypothetical protein
MVSEGDLLNRNDEEQRTRRDWWLAMLAEGAPLSADFVAGALADDPAAELLMTKPVITVTETTPVEQVAQLLTDHHIKRVPVLSRGKMVGIVSRADLLRALAERAAPSETTWLGPQSRATQQEPATKPAASRAPVAASPLLAADLRALTEQFEATKQDRVREAQRQTEQQAKTEVTDLLAHHIDEVTWKGWLELARQQAAHGGTELLLLRFPSELCSDGGRAINAPETDWPTTLRGEAAEIFRRWETELRPAGFGLAAKILDFPGGFPGHVGMFLHWGG